MATYSVYNYDTRAYDYYRGPGPRGTHAGSPPRSRAKNALGAAPEAASWRLPIGAVKIGSGELPRGRIASSSAGVAMGMGITDSPVSLGIAGVLAYLAWKVLR